MSTFEFALTKFLEFDKKKREAKETLEDVTKSHQLYAAMLTEQMALQDVQRVTKEGMTVYRKTMRSVAKKEGVTTDQVAQELVNHGYGYMVKPGYSPTSLKSLVLEGGVPAEITDLLNVTEFHTVNAIRST